MSSALVSQISNSCTSPTSYWEPQSAFLRATYAGDGRFELDCTTASAAALLSLVKSIQYPLVTQVGDHHRDYCFDLERFLGSECPGFNAAGRQQRLPADLAPLLGEIEGLWAYLSNAVTHNRAFVWCHISRQVRQLAFFPVHESAYKGLIDFTMQSVDYGQHDYAPESFVARVLAKVRDDASGRLSRRTGDADPQISQWAEDYLFDDSVFQAICESGRLDSSGIWAIRWLCTEGTEREALRNDLPLEKQVEFLWPMLEQVYANIAIDRLNITLAPH